MKVRIQIGRDKYCKAWCFWFSAQFGDGYLETKCHDNQCREKRYATRAKAHTAGRRAAKKMGWEVEDT